MGTRCISKYTKTIRLNERLKKYNFREDSY